MKQRNGTMRVGIYRRATRFLPQGARDARKRQILDHGRAARGDWDDVIDVERRLLDFLRQAAVLAAGAGAGHDEEAEPPRHAGHDDFDR